MMMNRNIETIPTTGMGEEQWRDERMKGIGGSDVAGVLGISPWDTPVTVFLRKTMRGYDRRETEAMYWGNVLESVIADEYGKRTGTQPFKYGYIRKMGCMLGNVDRLVKVGDEAPADGDAVHTPLALECKTARDKGDWDDDVPLHYQAQVQHYMALLPSVQRFDLPVLFKIQTHFGIYGVKRDDEAIEKIIIRVNEFWERHVVPNVAPDPVCEDDCKFLWAKSKGKSVTASDGVGQAVARYRNAAVEQERIRTELAEARDIITVAMGEADTLVDAQGKTLCTWKTAKDSMKVDYEAILDELNAPNRQELVTRHTSVTQGSRRFLVKDQN